MSSPTSPSSPAADVSLWMLDTNIISQLMLQPAGTAAQRMVQALASVSNAALCTSVIVDAELQFGLQKNPSSKLQNAYELTLAALYVLPLGKDIAVHYGSIRAYLDAQGTPIGPNDLLIAAHARALGATLVTDNELEFNRVPGLRVDNWLR
jgi:tRNA(fMet)-specific endonuclease VapC